jgi:hypothetical protein
VNRWLASRWLLLTILFGIAAFWLSWYLKDGSVFTAVATVGLGGGHLTNGLRDARNASRNPGIEEDK